MNLPQPRPRNPASIPQRCPDLQLSTNLPHPIHPATPNTQTSIPDAAPATTQPVMMQLLLGLALCMWAGLAVPAKFLSVLPHSEENSCDHEEQMDFVILKVEKRDMMISQRKKA
uniref:Uncharacterized protein n=1 Tax=Oryza rufipogon TaxID=4529 RepID=A0A0E0R9V1_ORYRU